jgi:hypothetical protein
MKGYEVYSDLPDDDQAQDARFDCAMDILRHLKSKSEVDDGAAAFTALQDAMVLLISGMCPDCRKKMAKVLPQRVPVMISCANHMAAGHQEHLN